MDTELLRTFLEVNKTRHFARAAANLYLTQSAVSSRIRMLEQIVGVPLFTRRRNDIRLTPEGRKLKEHAETILTAWSRARQEIAVEEQGKSSLNIAVIVGLASVLLDDWLINFRANNPEVVVNVELLETESALRRLREGTLDVALMFESAQEDGLLQQELADIRFVLMSTTRDQTVEEALADEYVLVNWGMWFTVSHAKHFPDLPMPQVRVDSGRLARLLLLGRGGSAYLAERMVARDVEAGLLFAVADAPNIERTAFAVYPAESENRHTIETALTTLPDYA